MNPPSIDLSDIYTSDTTREVDSYRHFVSIFIDQIWVRHFDGSAPIRDKTHAQLQEPSAYPSPTACHFTRKIVEYYLALGRLGLDGAGRLVSLQPVEDRDPGDVQLDEFLRRNPDKRNFFGILRNIRDVIGEVLFKGEDALLTMANDDFHQAMALWEDLMENAPVKKPCHHLVLRALQRELTRKDELTVFEGGAGVGAILRDAAADSDLVRLMHKLERYFYTDISLSLIKLGREWLRARLPPAVFERIEFKVLDLDKLDQADAPYAAAHSVDLIVLEHVLYDVTDLAQTLARFRRMLKPDGLMVFTMAFRSSAQTFFPFEYLQSTFQSYHKARLEPHFRENIGYLTLDEWSRSLLRAGFARFEVYPDPSDQLRWPYGGIIAYPSE